MNYKLKYIKYKTKYVNLQKTILGGMEEDSGMEEEIVI